MRPLTIIAALGTAGGVLAACAGPTVQAGPSNEPQPAIAPTQAAPAQDELRFMLKLKNPSTPVDTPSMLAHLANVGRSDIIYVRAMSGDAHVLILRPHVGTTAQQALKLIADDASVEYAEPDAIRRALPSR